MAKRSFRVIPLPVQRELDQCAGTPFAIFASVEIGAGDSFPNLPGVHWHPDEPRPEVLESTIPDSRKGTWARRNSACFSRCSDLRGRDVSAARPCEGFALDHDLVIDVATVEPMRLGGLADAEGRLQIERNAEISPQHSLRLVHERLSACQVGLIALVHQALSQPAGWLARSESISFRPDATIPGIQSPRIPPSSYIAHVCAAPPGEEVP